jgi:hypothetical protein
VSRGSKRQTKRSTNKRFDFRGQARYNLLHVGQRDIHMAEALSTGQKTLDPLFLFLEKEF